MRSIEVPLTDCLEAAIAASKEAGTILQKYAHQGFHVEHKGLINLVTDADRAVEQRIIDYLTSRFSSHRFLAEERGHANEGDSPYLWIIDPLDGTTNFAHGFPVYCISIGLEYRGSCVLGVIFDPSRDELFTATHGGGAFLNGHSLQVTEIDVLDRSLLVTGFAYDIRETDDNNLNHFARFALRAQGIRRTGSAALDLCYVAAGRFDGFWEVKLNPWDMAAGSVIVREAGGQVTNLQGQALSVYGHSLVASNGRIHQAMLAVLNKTEPRRPSKPQ